MMRRLEQVAALVVAAGLALVSYWLFFSWAQGGGARHRLPSQAPAPARAPAAPMAGADREAMPPPPAQTGGAAPTAGDRGKR